MEEKVILRSYDKAWKFEHKIYAIDDYRLLVPINPDTLVYLVVGFLLTLGLLKVFPFLNGIPFIIRYFILPYGLMKFLTKKKFDGKLPHRFLIGYAEYFCLPKKIARFQNVASYKPGHFTSVVYRKSKIVNVMDEWMSKREPKGGVSQCINSQSNTTKTI